MVDMNVIVLEGIGLYIVLAIFLFMTIAASLLAWSGIRQDEKNEILREQLFEEREKNIKLNHDNMRYKLKYGELDPGKEP